MGGIRSRVDEGDLDPPSLAASYDRGQLSPRADARDDQDLLDAAAGQAVEDVGDQRKIRNRSEIAARLRLAGSIGLVLVGRIHDRHADPVVHHLATRGGGLRCRRLGWLE